MSVTTSAPADEGTATESAAIDPAKVDQFGQRIIGDLGAALSAVLIQLGDRLGLYRAMGDNQPVTAQQLAERTGLAERYVREWLHNQAAAGWVSYQAQDATFVLSPEHALLVANDTSPHYLLGGFGFPASCWADEEKLADAFTSGRAG